MDIRHTIEAKSDQINASDLLTPRTLMVIDCTPGAKDQPVNIHYGDNEKEHNKTGNEKERKKTGNVVKVFSTVK